MDKAMKVNYHTHTRRCRHAAGSEEDYIRAALEAGVSILGFSDHAPFPDRDYGYRMPYSEQAEYFGSVERLAKVYAPRLTVLKSLEIEYLPQYRDHYEQLLYRQRTDYLLLGEHYYFDARGNVWNYTQMAGTESYLDYARSLAEGMKTGYFQMVAHPDVFTLNPFPWDRNCDAAVDMILEAAVLTDTILEFNANGLRRGLQDYPDGRRYMYPHMNFWNRVPGAGVRVVVGSDCHQPGQLWDDCMEASYRCLSDLGITPVKTLSRQ